MNNHVLIYVDGAFERHLDRGAWGAVFELSTYPYMRQEHYGGPVPQTTSQRMEIQAAIEALSRLKWPCTVELYSDSQYLIETMRGNFRKHTNHDLWKSLEAAASSHTVDWIWIRRTSPELQRPHELANQVLGIGNEEEVQRR